jgi:hypothetical protein
MNQYHNKDNNEDNNNTKNISDLYLSYNSTEGVYRKMNTEE